MKFYKKPTFTNFAPNQTAHDVMTACSFLFLPWKWMKLRKGPNAERVEAWLAKYFGVEHAIAFDSGRSSLYYALKALGAGEGVEVLAQGYTCMVVANAILWTGAAPVYVDITNDLNMDPEDLKKKITPKSKILIIQHTFGLPANMDALLAIAKEHDLKVVEDCAHSLGARYAGQLTGTFGDIAMFSFGSSKVVSCVRGGATITRDAILAKKLLEFRSRLPAMPLIKVFQHLAWYPIFAIAKPLYNLWIGKLILAAAKILHITARVMEPAEKNGKRPLWSPSLFPNALASILLNQFRDLDATNERRDRAAKKYSKRAEWKREHQRGAPGRVWLYFPVFVGKPLALAERLRKKEGMIVGADWTGSVIVPRGSDLARAGYKKGMCPNAERLSERVINLPTR
ncbi:MAG: hypothetical protein A3C90_02555 [Candidatus Magasanikbacteria bacterium RIFCSPHIGHO2_02_FULL_51_14]|uniref:DegT/DnrJ/EryC1/StrS aminotransferase n=1 Tax=Candidatus Magasanikbacteria bacterium RIFCSPHIGHO2_02_FULL_51_14 TaxID=1798683 RepID=A0A1F6MD69_9BACT|nr:MAG: hypothetical protein A3C90_02555 [Candidatus Magasanikbacteria bacterium RIFCSPHIGHO2_02_FULL_51_14]